MLEGTQKEEVGRRLKHLQGVRGMRLQYSMDLLSSHSWCSVSRVGGAAVGSGCVLAQVVSCNLTCMRV